MFNTQVSINSVSGEKGIGLNVRDVVGYSESTSSIKVRLHTGESLRIEDPRKEDVDKFKAEYTAYAERSVLYPLIKVCNLDDEVVYINANVVGKISRFHAHTRVETSDWGYIDIKMDYGEVALMVAEALEPRRW